MENQHKKIKGYRDLSQEEIDLMNQIKDHGEKTKLLIDELNSMRTRHSNDILGGRDCVINNSQLCESIGNLKLAKQYLQTGQMWFVRAVALPDSF